jgi:hypothetical protein
MSNVSRGQMVSKWWIKGLCERLYKALMQQMTRLLRKAFFYVGGATQSNRAGLRTIDGKAGSRSEPDRKTAETKWTPTGLKIEPVGVQGMSKNHHRLINQIPMA